LADEVQVTDTVQPGTNLLAEMTAAHLKEDQNENVLEGLKVSEGNKETGQVCTSASVCTCVSVSLGNFVTVVIACSH